MLQVTGLPLGTWIVEGLEIMCCKFGSFSMRYRRSVGCWPETFFQPIIDLFGRDVMKPYEQVGGASL